jgi:bifunctional UDP-N-acetylglucosamine pyrophosphorylase/glucosamine-1-phosphate N-acetyltransferase
MNRQRAAVILAAGLGTRMRSDLPKVLHQVGGRAMVDWAIATAQAAGVDRLVVVTSPKTPLAAAHVAARFGEASIAVQDPPQGTGHAVLCAKDHLADFDGDVVVLYGDCPLITPQTLQAAFAAKADGPGVVVVGFEAQDPTGYGRLIQDSTGAITRIVEEKDASAAERAVRLCNSGVMCADRAVLFSLLSMVKNDNAKGEYYLTDVVGLARSSGFRAGVVLASEAEVLGVNSRLELAAAERAFQQRARQAFLLAGVTMIDPDTVYFHHDTQIASDVRIEPNVVFGLGVRIGKGATIKAFCHLEGCAIGEGCSVGPFARLRPGADLGARVKIGNFVEIKNARFGEDAQASHLTYVGDADVGARANLGCGTITCNYDGFDKHKTIIGEDAFIGSDTALVAPVRIGARAFTGSGSVITRDVADDALSVARGRQRDIEGWSVSYRARKLAERAARGGKRKEAE